jgi:hypothetical protein
MAAITDKFTKAYDYFSTTLSGSITNADTTIACADLSDLASVDTAVYFVIDYRDANGAVKTDNSREICKGVISGDDFINCTRGLGGTTAQSHSASAVVELLSTAVGHNDLIDGILAGHNQDGTHDFDTLYDTNGNEMLKTSVAASAVNEVTVNNAATGGVPGITASGGDTNVHVQVIGKGNGLTKTSVLRQDDTADSYKHNAIILSGWGVGTPGAASILSEAITFGVTFAQRPIVILTYGGDDTGAATTLGSGGAERKMAVATAHTVTTTGFTARLSTPDATNWTAGDTVFYHWMAIGELA